MSLMKSSPADHQPNRQTSNNSVASDNHSLLLCPDSAFHYATSFSDGKTAPEPAMQRQCNEKNASYTSNASLSPLSDTASTLLQPLQFLLRNATPLKQEDSMEVPKIDATVSETSKTTTPATSVLLSDEYDPANPLHFSNLKKWSIVIVIANGAFCVTCCACLITVS